MPAKENDLPRKNADGYYRKDITFRGRKYAVRSKTLKGLFTKLAEKKRMLEAGMLIPTENTYAADWCVRWLEEYQRAALRARAIPQLPRQHHPAHRAQSGT